MNQIITTNDRVINLFETITETSCKQVLDKIITIISKYDEESNKKDFKPEPIMLIINTYGGEVHASRALINFIKIQKYPIYIMY